MKQFCQFCKFYEKTDEETGECRFNPPNVVFHKRLFTLMEVTIFPKVPRNFWCGKHKEIEE